MIAGDEFSRAWICFYLTIRLGSWSFRSWNQKFGSIPLPGPGMAVAPEISSRGLKKGRFDRPHKYSRPEGGNEILKLVYFTNEKAGTVVTQSIEIAMRPFALLKFE
jgi:hypothetical protein